MGFFDPEKFASNLRAERARADLTQEELASKAGISAGAINGYESGSCAPGADKICALASALGCTPNDLFCWGK